MFESTKASTIHPCSWSPPAAALRLTAAALVAAALADPCAAQSAEQTAAEILQIAGVQGGLVVHVGCGDGKLTAAFSAGERYLVQGLDADPANVEAARQSVIGRGLWGRVTIEPLAGKQLPYADNLVNLLVSEDLAAVPMGEVMRVLAPGGVACLKSGRLWQKTVKPWPDDIDQWTHFLHAPDNNAVADDTRIEPPHHIQWEAGPRWGRSHDHLASMSAAVSAAGRIFYVIDEGPVASVAEPARWMLVARDAFSGVLLWKKQIGPWEDHLRPFRSGPAELPRRLVAVENRVYATLGYGEAVTALDAATGEVVRTYEGTTNTHEILCHQGKLFLVVGEPLSQQSGTSGEVIRRLPLWRDFYAEYVTVYPRKHLRCLDAESGELLWTKNDADTQRVLPLTLAVSQRRVFFENEQEVLALDAESGAVLWRAKRPAAVRRYAWSSPTLVVQEGVVLSADRAADADLDTGGGDGDENRLQWLVSANHLLTGGEIIAFSAATGEKLWSAPCHEGFNFPVDVFVAHGKVFSGELAWGKQPGITKVYDLHTGEVVAERPPDQECYTIGFGHARCYRNKATTKYVLHGRSGVEFLDMSSNRVVADHWIRGTCQYGILPCNGMLYVPPHSCACYIDAKLSNFNALAPKRDEGPEARGEGQRLERGPAYGRVQGSGSGVQGSGFRVQDSQIPGSNSQLPTPNSQLPTPSDWPTYRGDTARSGAAACALSPRLVGGWEKQYAGPLTGVVLAGARLLFAQIDRHTVHALRAADGSPIWQFTAGGRIDSPPAVCEDRVYFGSADGWIYCLRADDGELAWRFRAAPESRRIVSYDQLASVWPVPGNVLVHRGEDPSLPPVVYAVAGRSSYLDGGMLLVGLNARTGRLVCERRISHRDPETGREPQETVRGVLMPGVLPDVLSTDGSSLFLRHARFDLQGNDLPQDAEHLFSSVGFLDDNWWHRTYWQLGTNMLGGYGGWPVVGNARISGRLLVPAGDRVYGFGRREYGITGAHVGIQAEHQLFAADAKLIEAEPEKGRKQPPATQVRYLWSKGIPFYARAMLVAGETLFAAGPCEIRDLAAENPTGEVWLWAVSASDGAPLAEYKLKAAPVFDSMAAAAGGLYFTTVDGRVACFRSEN